MTKNLRDLVGDRVRFHRTESSMSRRVLAEDTDISERYLAQLEAGKANISILLIERIAKSLGVSLTELMKPRGTPAISNKLARYLSTLDGKSQQKALSLLEAHFETEPKTGHKGIALVGMRGAGKSTLGRILAANTGLPFVRLSDRIAENSGMPISELMGLGGMTAYRRHELEALQKLVDCSGRKVLEVSGGIAESPQAFELLLTHFHTVYVKASAKDHVERVTAQNDTRPMEGYPEAVKEAASLLAARTPVFERAHDTIDTTGQTLKKSEQALGDLMPKFRKEDNVVN